MTEWGVALIAAGSALLASLISGIFARSAGRRQAAAMLETVRITVEQQRQERALAARRATYLRFLDAAETVLLARRVGGSTAEDRAALQRAMGAVQLEGPGPAVNEASALLEALRRERGLDELERARFAFIAAAREALRAGDAPRV
ncbi:hypothetical protein FH609_027520 [Streptomyces sp. 3MP-14]|uniref:Protein kilB n=1 Tax=Streptomyces mimosae TaxID=2586635 RepID=A0A5N5ZZD0_9ACTN|nr:MULTISPECIES: hypothetical protein [Streptomyces]KAB8161292.1 hypothetical protein FH607_026015 [Streptomyces mimosae]KAB8173094.1 hypothetical protein FH609_027520 [Streptomyces sp. 3MP-14]